MKRDSQDTQTGGHPSVQGLASKGPVDWKKQTDGQRVRSLGLHFPEEGA